MGEWVFSALGDHMYMPIQPMFLLRPSQLKVIIHIIWELFRADRHITGPSITLRINNSCWENPTMSKLTKEGFLYPWQERARYTQDLEHWQMSWFSLAYVLYGLLLFGGQGWSKHVFWDGWGFKIQTIKHWLQPTMSYSKLGKGIKWKGLRSWYKYGENGSTKGDGAGRAASALKYNHMSDNCPHPSQKGLELGFLYSPEILSWNISPEWTRFNLES